MSLWDLYQQGQIRSMRASVASAEVEALHRARRQEAGLDEVDERVDRLATVVEALWTLCRDHLGLTDAELETAIQATIEREAAERAAGPVRCACGAAIGHELDRCQFCGAPAPGRDAFDT